MMKDFIVSFLVIFLAAGLAQANEVCLSLQKPISTAKDNFSSDNLDELGKLPAKVTWQKIDNANYYLLLISRTPDFKKARAFKRTARHMPLMVYPNTKYYWKVSAFNKDGDPLNKDTFEPFNFSTKYTGENEILTPMLTLYNFYKKKVEDASSLPPFPETEIAQGVLEIDGTTDLLTNKTKLSPEDYQVYCGSQRQVASVNELGTQINEYPLWLQGNRAWISTEAGMIDFNQNFQQVAGLPPVSSRGLMFPSLSAHFQSARYGDFRGEVYFQQVIGDFNVSTPGVVLLDQDFNWLTYGAHLDYDLTNFTLFNRLTSLSIYLGAEKTKTPFFSLVSSGFVAVEDLDMINAYLGTRLETARKRNWSYFLDLRYSQPFSPKSDALSSATINSSTLADLALGGSYEINNGFFTGLEFKGSYRDFQESLSGSAFTNATGSRTTIYFAIEAMAGINF